MLDAVVDYLPSPARRPADDRPRRARPGEGDHRASPTPRSRSRPWRSRSRRTRSSASSPTSGCTPARSPPAPRCSTRPRARRSASASCSRCTPTRRTRSSGATAGHIYAMIGLKDTTTGDTLCDPADQVVLESMTFPEPVISVAIEPKTKGDQEKLGTAIQKLAEEDPTFQVQPGRGDRPDHHRRHGRAPPGHPGRPHAPRVQGRGQRRQAAGGLPRDDPSRRGEVRLHPQEADRWVRPVREGPDHLRAAGHRTRASCTSSRTRSPVAASRASTSRSVDHGIQDAMQLGVLAGYPLVGIKATCSTAPTTTSTPRRWRSRSPARWCSRKPSARPTPCCSSRSWPSRSVRPRTTWATSSATSTPAVARSSPWRTSAAPRSSGPLVPLSEMFGYVGDLRSKTQGRAIYSHAVRHLRRGSPERRRGDHQEDPGRVTAVDIRAAV